ncbi:hypothetical protein GDO81_011667 [Engystomops pustulosus]|uniref:Uncharacterized protein n=3 Tax=Engystomops pustulosus TaxID=76066 RepID=A0AAV7BFW1_ENGPU|nr:hypothetical protein GDO81_011667 [Engystomops pustulosus]
MTEESSEVPKELQESIRDVIGRKIKIAVRKKVKLEIKGDKVENKVLVLTSCRAFILTARVPTKLELTFSYLEIQGITCNKPGHLVVETEKGSISLKMVSSDDVNEVIAHIGTCLRKIFPGLSPVKIMKKVTMEPPDRLANLQALWDSQTVTEVGPCGGFSQMYACVCDWLSMPYREEVQWDVDTIYLTQDTRELNLQDFSHLDHRDLIPIVAALEYNLWFTKLSSKDLKLSNDVCDQILRVVSRSSRLEELVLENAGLRIDFAQKLSNALAYNPNSGLHTINLANNPIEDRGVSFLSTQFAKLPKGLMHLNLSKTSISPKGVNSLSQSLSATQLIASTLTHLDLSGNILRGDDLSCLYTFLAQPNTIKNLDLSNTECSADAVCGALLRGCLQHLTTLNLSKTFFPYRKGKEVPPSFKQFFSSSLALTHINFSGTKLSPEPLKALLLGLACNPNLKEVSLDLSNCELRSGGAQVLEGCIAEIHNITSLDISDNGLESDLSTLVVWLSKNRSIRHLALGKNFNNMKSKNLTPVLDNLVHMIQDEESPLQSLSLADSKLKTDVTIIINALGSNTSLTKVDISGNGMGDMGAKMLAKALQINTKLRTVIWDKNNITAQGFQDISVALEKNYTLRFMPIPINDASQALKTNPERTEEALQKIENYLLRNHETRKYLQEQAYRLQQSIVTSTTQHMIDRICVKVQDHLNSLRNCGIDFVLEDVKSAERVMRDAKNSKTLLPNLYHLGGAAWAGANSLPTPIQETLESMAGEVTKVVDDQLKQLLESMVDAAEDLCPNVMKKAHIRQDLIQASTEKISIPRNFVKNVLLEQSGIDILNKISEVKLTVASFLSDRIVDEILDALSSSHHKLAEHLSKRGKPLPHQESMEIETVEEKPTKRSGPTVEELSEMERLEDLDTCMMTPKSKRKSIHSRMLRPVSRAFEMEFDLDKALEDVPIHIEDPPYPSYKQDKRSSSVIAELPSEEGKKLEHFTKLRPKRMKKQQPSKSNACRHGQDNLLQFKPSISMGKKGDLSAFERAMVVGARRPVRSISETADLLGFSRTTISRVYRKWSEKEKTSGERQFCGRKCLVDARGQRRMGRLVRADRKATVTQIATRYNQGRQKSISERTVPRTLRQMGYSSRRPHRVPLLSAKNRKLRLQFAQAHRNWTVEDWKNVAWSDESRFLLRHSDGRVRIWCQQHESMDPSCRVSTVQAGGGGVMVWGIFSWHSLGPLVPIEHRCNATAYLSIVADHVHPFMTTMYPTSDGYFQQDNAPCHEAGIISDWFLEHDNEVTVLKWPPQSPDLNPIEHLWDVVEREIRIMDVQPTNLRQLCDAIMSIWTKISEECKRGSNPLLAWCT